MLRNRIKFLRELFISYVLNRKIKQQIQLFPLIRLLSQEAAALTENIHVHFPCKLLTFNYIQEISRLHKSPSRILPAYKRFGSHNFPAAYLNNRLEIHNEFLMHKAMYCLMFHGISRYGLPFYHFIVYRAFHKMVPRKLRCNFRSLNCFQRLRFKSCHAVNTGMRFQEVSLLLLLNRFRDPFMDLSDSFFYTVHTGILQEKHIIEFIEP